MIGQVGVGVVLLCTMMDFECICERKLNCIWMEKWVMFLISLRIFNQWFRGQVVSGILYINKFSLDD